AFDAVDAAAAMHCRCVSSRDRYSLLSLGPLKASRARLTARYRGKPNERATAFAAILFQPVSVARSRARASELSLRSTCLALISAFSVSDFRPKRIALATLDRLP